MTTGSAGPCGTTIGGGGQRPPGAIHWQRARHVPGRALSQNAKIGGDKPAFPDGKAQGTTRVLSVVSTPAPARGGALGGSACNECAT